MNPASSTTRTLTAVFSLGLIALAPAELTLSTGTVVGSFVTGDRDSATGDYTVDASILNTIPGANLGVLHVDGLYMLGQVGAWVPVLRNGNKVGDPKDWPVGPITGTDNQSGSDITFTYAAAGDQFNHGNVNEANTGLRKSYYRWLNDFPATGTSFTITGLDDSKAYDLIFYSGGEFQGQLDNRYCLIKIGDETATPDLDGDSNFTGVSPTSGVIQGNLIPTPGNTITRLAGVQVAEVAPPVPFRFVITPNTTVPGAYDFEWESKDSKAYDLVSSTDLSVPINDWPVWEEQTAMLGTAPSNTLIGIPGGGDTKRFFAMIEMDGPPLLDEDFEAVVGLAPPTGWTRSNNGAGTAWEVGTPALIDGDFTPNGAANGLKCAGTNINGIHTASSDSSLVTKAFTVPATGATLSFSQYIDTEFSPSDDVGSVRLLNAGDNSVLAGGDLFNDIEGITAAWTEESIPLPAVANGLSVKIEFRFVSDADAENFAGFYIDDVLVTGN